MYVIQVELAHECSAHKGQKRLSDFLVLELQVVVSWPRSAGSWVL